MHDKSDAHNAPFFLHITQRCTLLPLLISVLGLLLLAGNASAAPDDAKAQPKKEHVAALFAEKEARTAAQSKLDSHLLFGARKHRGEQPVPGLDTLQVDVPAMDDQGRVTVEIIGNVTGALLAAIEKHGGKVLLTYAPDRTIVAAVPLQKLEKLAEHSDVQIIRTQLPNQYNTGPVDSEGDTTHAAIDARRRYGTDGTGVKIGVISNGVDTLADSQSEGELPGNVTVLSGQAGKGDEGTAMLEIVHDIAPGAQLFFATGGDVGTAILAANIRALKAAGCNIIIDDLNNASEPPFQDGPVSVAVNEVSAAGVLYFSSAANSGNKTSGTASTWEGDFVDGGPLPFPTPLPFPAPPDYAGRIHSFGPKTFNTNPTDPTGIGPDGQHPQSVNLYWNDPLGKSSNDYDLVLTDDAGNITSASTTAQKGTQDPIEIIPPADLTNGTGRRGTRIFIVRKQGAATRYLHLSTERNPLEISTTGSTRGHNASGAANAFCVAAAPAIGDDGPGQAVGPFPNLFTTATKFETYSSDGPRRIFYQADGTAITPNDLSATGGLVLQKPDFTAADRVNTSVEGFAPFRGTSAAAPCAGAIAALILSKFPVATNPQIRDALSSTALDIGAAGWDRDSGLGIIMPIPALNKLSPPPAIISVVGSSPNFSANPNQAVQKPTSQTDSVTVNIKVTGAPFGGGSVHFFTQDGTAKCGAPNMEYACIDQIFNFGQGDTITPVKINIFTTGQDFFPAGNGNFTVNLNNPIHGTIGTATGKITILDTNAPSVTLSVADTQVVEANPLAPVPGGTANAEFIVSLSAPSDRIVLVHAQTADATATATNNPLTNDYTPVSVTLNFQPGETMKSVLVPVVDTPGRNEPEETFTLNLATAVNATLAKSSAICTIHQPVTPGPAVNISTRMRVLTGSNVLIAGFIVTGTEPKKVIIRGIGPSLAGILPGALTDTTLELHQGANTLATNDNWKINAANQQSQEAEVQATTIPPGNDLESALIATLDPGAYTAILAGKNGGQGIGVVEVYDLSLSSISELANISTRGFVDAGDNVMIGGFIVGATTESGPSRLIIRALGPSLPLTGTLQDPMLELHDASGTVVASNDNWKDTQEAEIRFTTIPPTDDRESAIVQTLTRGAYTAVVRGKDNSVGIALVEVYKIN